MTTLPEDHSSETIDMDPVLLSVLASRFETIVREMTNTLFRTGRSSVLNMARDFSCCVVTSDNQVLAAAEGLQVHVLGAGLQTSSMLNLHPDLEVGDAFLHNDPFLGNTHTADHTILVPVFYGGQHIFTAAAKAHQADCGNSEPTTYMAFARDVYEEGGLNFPCIQVQRGYKDIDDVIRMCRRRIRVPDIWYGDYLATLGAARVGERRIIELVERYGMETIQRFVRDWLNSSERAMAAAIRRLPAKRLVASSAHDAIKFAPKGIPITVAVEIAPNEGIITVDLRDNPDCVDGGVNLSEATATSGAIIGVLNAIADDVPRNAGTFRRIKVLLRNGCVVGIPPEPVCTSLATTNVLERVINPVQAAFAQLGAGYGLAEGGGACGVGFAVVSGTDRRKGGQPFINQMIIGSNGGPGTPTCDGWVTYCMPDAAMVVYSDSVEVLEQRYPILIYSAKLLADSGGAGRYRGAPATEVSFGPRFDELRVFYASDFAQNAAQGVLGGAAGSLAQIWHVGIDGMRSRLPAIGDVTLAPGERIIGSEAGGGGYGNPLHRPAHEVLNDVVEKWISRSHAESAYAVRIVESFDRRLAVDEEATARLRAGWIR
jgi:N-methylhydantoinase B